MAKITGPLFSTSAHGSIGRQITHQSGKIQPQAKNWSKPTGARSPRQTARRLRFLTIAATWAILTQEQRAPYEATAKHRHITGWNVFLSEQLKNNPPGLGVLWDLGFAEWDAGGAVWT